MLIVVLGTFTKSGVSNFGTNLAIFITLIKIVLTAFIEHHASRSYLITLINWLIDEMIRNVFIAFVS